MDINVLLFDDFTALDAFGPVEVLCRIPQSRIRFFSLEGGAVKNHQNINIMTEKVREIDLDAVWLIPGGFGTRTAVNDEKLMGLLAAIGERSEYCLTVCTGSAMLAKAGALNGRRAASNHRAFEWVKTCSDKVLWDESSRYVRDGKFYTSAGVSAGIDMAFGFVSDLLGADAADDFADAIEYERR